MVYRFTIRKCLKYHCRVACRTLSIIFKNSILWGAILTLLALYSGSWFLYWKMGSEWTKAELAVNAWTVAAVVLGLIGLLFLYAVVRAPVEIDSILNSHLSAQRRISQRRGEMIASLRKLGTRSEETQSEIAWLRQRLQRLADRVRSLDSEQGLGRIQVDAVMRSIETDLCTLLVSVEGWKQSGADFRTTDRSRYLEAKAKWLESRASTLTSRDILAGAIHVQSVTLAPTAARRDERVVRAKEVIDDLVLHGEYLVRQQLDCAAYKDFKRAVNGKLVLLIGRRAAATWMSLWDEDDSATRVLVQDRGAAVQRVTQFANALRDFRNAIVADDLSQQFLDG